MWIGLIGRRTIKIGSWDFSHMRIFSSYPADIQSNWYRLASEVEWKKLTNWSELQKAETVLSILLGSEIILSYRLSK